MPRQSTQTGFDRRKIAPCMGARVWAVRGEIRAYGSREARQMRSPARPRGMTPSMPSRLLWILLLALACGPALALGLGQIEVKSRPGEPLLAEIPIVSSDPSELEQLQARLASPETFARVGLEPPSGLVQDLQFTIGLDGRGRPVIRVTTQAPVQQPLLTFLLEVDWGQGRLVREYSALIEAPETVAAVAQPPMGFNAINPEKFPVQIAFNLIPHIDSFLDNGFTKEEMKLVWETRKILGDDSIQVNPTAVRVPVFYGHSEAVAIETREKVTAQAARELLAASPGVEVVDDRKPGGYPTPVTYASGKDAVYVG